MTLLTNNSAFRDYKAFKLILIFLLLIITLSEDKIIYAKEDNYSNHYNNTDMLVFNVNYTKVAILGKDNKEKFSFSASIADTFDLRLKGLMFVKEMDTNKAMLFIYPYPQNISMWMKNTYIPLDMLFIDKDKKIINIVQNTTPHSLESNHSNGIAKYVLEINAGVAKTYNFKIGDKVEFDYDGKAV